MYPRRHVPKPPNTATHRPPFVFNTRCGVVGPGARVEAGMAADACLDAGFLIRADDVIVGAKRFFLPETRIKIENDLGLLGKTRIARDKSNTRTRPRFQVGIVQDAPNSTWG